MDFKEFSENQEIEYRVIATVDGEEVGSISGSTYESVSEDWRKLDHAVSEKITELWEDLPENQESEDEE